MKRAAFLCVLAVLGVGFFLWYQSSISRSSEQRGGHQINLGDAKLSVEFARTREERGRGLMYRTQLAEDAGMLFLFTHTERQTFWNKNTYIPLDVIWLRKDTVVGMSSLPSIDEGLTTISSPTEVDRVLEVNRGWSERHNIQIGTRMW